MPEAAIAPPAPPVPSAQPVRATPQSALANFLKVEAEPPSAPPVQPKPAAPTAAPPPEKPPVAAAPPPEPDKPPTNAQKWKEFTQARDAAIKEREDRIAILQADMKKLSEQAKALPADDPEKLVLKKERDELSQKLWTVSRENHPEFKAKYDKQIDTALNMVQQIIGGDAGKKLVKILKSGDPENRDAQIEELLEAAGQFKMSRVAPIINTLDQLQSARTQELNVSKEEFDQMVSQHEANSKSQAAAAAKQQRTMVEKVFDDTLNGFRDKEKGLRELQERDGDETWNNSVKARINEAKQIVFGEAKPERVIQAILHDAAFDAVKSDRDALAEKNKALEAQVAAFTSTSPGLRLPGNPGGNTPGRPPAMNRAATPQEALKHWIKAGENTE